jgi:hypothetical protein
VPLSASDLQEEEREKAIAKARKFQRELEEVEGRAEAAETEADKLKLKLRTSVVRKPASVDEDNDDADDVDAASAVSSLLLPLIMSCLALRSGYWLLSSITRSVTSPFSVSCSPPHLHKSKRFHSFSYQLSCFHKPMVYFLFSLVSNRSLPFRCALVHIWVFSASYCPLFLSRITHRRCAVFNSQSTCVVS